MIVLMLTEKGRVEPTNYRTTHIPSNAEIPIYTKVEFGSFYRAMFDTQVKKDDMSVVYLEYAWDMGWCDPCAADPVPNDKLAASGAFWVDQAASLLPRRSGDYNKRGSRVGLQGDIDEELGFTVPPWMRRRTPLKSLFGRRLHGGLP